MISKSFPATRKPWWSTVTGYNNIGSYTNNLPVTQGRNNYMSPSYDTMVEVRAKRMKITPEEWKRRDAIVKDLYSKCTWRPGDSFFVPKDRVEKYGERCLVTQIAASYIDIEQDDWLDTDNPYILTVRTLSPDIPPQVYVCTWNFPKKAREE